MAELAEFQRAAVKRITDRLTDPSGSHRFLLADEVGLGKTLVARGVIDALRAEKRGGGLTVVYVCSNSEIAGQNRGKLSDSAVEGAPRLSLLSLESAEIRRRAAQGLVQVYSFTPGTSLQVGQSTGIKHERRLLLYLVGRILGRRVNRSSWRTFFRCGAAEESWMQESKFSRLQKNFRGKLATDLQRRLRLEWRDAKIQVLDKNTGKLCAAAPLRERLDECVKSFRADSETSRKNRNRLIGQLRQTLCRVTLEFFQPDLVILDEFQRFSEVLKESSNPDSLVARLFSTPSSCILIISATPYKMYTLNYEAENHHEAFMETYQFLQNGNGGPTRCRRMREMLQKFRDRLDEKKWVEGFDSELAGLRDDIERELQLVMCRTERNWYLEGATKGVREVRASNNESQPQSAELTEYVRLRNFLLCRKIADWNITDFWKSSPSIFSFMDSHYALIQRIKKNREPIPELILRHPDQLQDIGPENLKFRLLLSKMFGGSASTRGRSLSHWRFLWARPTYQYYEDDFFGQDEPQKYLIFSHWKFVPKAISVVVSDELERRVPRRRKGQKSVPLQFKKKVAFYPFDICYPSLVLAEAVHQLKPNMGIAARRRKSEVYAEAERRITELLRSANISVEKTRSVPLWQIVARLESKSAYKDQIVAALKASLIGGEGISEYYPSHIRQYLKWIEDDETRLGISKQWIRKLTHVALYSPAVCTLRAVRSVSEICEGEWKDILDLCFDSLRSYFNKPLVQAIIRNSTGSARTPYTVRVLTYCRRAHYQALIDEYLYLIKAVLQCKSVLAAVEHLGRVLSLGTGQPLVNRRTRTGRMAPRPTARSSHFALAFGEELSAASAGGAKTRRTQIREAFNSPFWPFVLATTSVGQEGLDLHLYCRDIVHWNLPSNPVDLEQREGRINRYDSLSIRQSIANDVPSPMLQDGDGNIWKAVFRTLDGSSSMSGLSPHWIYQNGSLGQGERSDEMIRRHLLFYAASNDVDRYQQLKRSLSIYRLVLGQPRQQDIIDALLKSYSGKSDELGERLMQYMVNLSPLSAPRLLPTDIGAAATAG